LAALKIRNLGKLKIQGAIHIKNRRVCAIKHSYKRLDGDL